MEEYWNIRGQFTKEKEPAFHAYRDQEVGRRYRFRRLADQLHTFNPMLYFLNKKSEPTSAQKTHTHEYLESISYRLPEEIM